ncbi:MAG: hypothetical protein FJ044_03500 [Candidatus Cloacimonetes bacterium]|nr:hypothetical protein [Candidatus Cloacimonadota bacterium]
MPKTNETTLVKSEFVRPAMRPEEMVLAWEEYESLRDKLEKPGDFIEFADRDGKPKKAPTKQWRTKLERFFGLSVEIVQALEEKMENGERLYKVRARAVHPKTGLYHEATGLCSTTEKINKPNKYHNAASHAETRAKNRAVLEFVGFGEVSAEEIESDEIKNSPAKPTTGRLTEEECSINHDALAWNVVKKEGPNKGREFKSCYKCNYFHWKEDDVTPAEKEIIDDLEVPEWLGQQGTAQI